MRLPGERVRRTRLIRGEKCVVAVDVDMVVPTDDPGEPCLESETIELLREVKTRADRGDFDWLRRHGQVYVPLGAA